MKKGKQKTSVNADSNKDKADKKNNIILSFKALALLALCFILWKIVFRNTYDLVNHAEDINPELFKRTLLLALSIFTLTASLYYFYKILLNNTIKNIALAIYSIITLFIIFEIIFMHLPISQGTGDAYCAVMWFRKYWKKNEMGYRDKPYNPAVDTLTNNIVFLGDSYVAGHGIKKTEDRMSNLLETKLGHAYRVFNLGRNGANTKDELLFLERFPYKFNKLILVHVPNDLEYMKNENSDENISNNQFEPGFFINESFFINFLSYTQIGGYFKYVLSTHKFKVEQQRDYPFSDTTLLNTHISNLYFIDSMCTIKNINLLIVSYPFPGITDTVAKRYYRNFISKLKENNLNYLDAEPICDLLPPRKQIVNKFDMHPSKQVQKMVADSIYERIKRDGWLNNKSPIQFH